MNDNLIIRIEDMKLLPQTYVFFENKESNTIYVFINTILISIMLAVCWMFFAKMDNTIQTNAKILQVEEKFKTNPMKDNLLLYNQLKVEMFVNLTDYHKIRLGQEVKISLFKDKQSNSGEISSNISFIEENIFVIEGKPYIRVESEIPRIIYYTESGKKLELYEGFEAEARIIISKERIIQLLLDKTYFKY